MKTSWKIALGVGAGLLFPAIAFAADLASSGCCGCGICPL